MKRIRIVQAVILFTVAAILTSCSTSRPYESYPPPAPPRASVSLIMNAGPGMVVSRYSDGRYYYRNPQGYIYWRGNGNRYYLDQRYVTKSYYNHNQYHDWRRYSYGNKR